MNGRTIAIAVAGLAAAATLVSAAYAGDHEHEEEEHEHRRGHSREHEGERGPAPERARTRAGAADPLYAKECGSCHVAFPPHMLPAASWKKMMAGLDRHFGQNAELDPDVRATIEGWLVERAGTGRRMESGEPLRITELGWFRRKHREVPAGAATRPEVKSMANCTACHPGAERWDFDEDRVKIPRG